MGGGVKRSVSRTSYRSNVEREARVKSDDGESPEGSAFTTRTGSYGKQSHLQGPWTLVRLHQHLSRVHPRRVERAQRELVIRRRAIVQRHAVPDAVKHEVEERPEVHLYERTSGWSSKASGVELKGVEARRDRNQRGMGGERRILKSVLKKRRAPRERGRTGTSVNEM